MNGEQYDAALDTPITGRKRQRHAFQEALIIEFDAEPKRVAETKREEAGGVVRFYARWKGDRLWAVITVRNPITRRGVNLAAKRISVALRDELRDAVDLARPGGH